MTSALEILANRSNDATNSAHAYRSEAQTWQDANKVDMKSYREGQAIGYLDARKIMEEELRRLCNRFQNGCLRIEDFGIVL